MFLTAITRATKRWIRHLAAPLVLGVVAAGCADFGPDEEEAIEENVEVSEDGLRANPCPFRALCLFQHANYAGQRSGAFEAFMANTRSSAIAQRDAVSSAINNTKYWVTLCNSRSGIYRDTHLVDLAPGQKIARFSSSDNDKADYWIRGSCKR